MGLGAGGTARRAVVRQAMLGKSMHACVRSGPVGQASKGKALLGLGVKAGQARCCQVRFVWLGMAGLFC